MVFRCIAMLALIAGIATPASSDTVTGIKAAHANVRNKPKVITKPVRAGKRALLFEVQDGQCAGNRSFDDCGSGRERSEIRDTAPVRTETETWYAFSILIPLSTPHIEPAGAILAQFQDGKGSGEITLGFEMWRDGLLLVQDNPHTSQRDHMNPPSPMIIKTIVPNETLRGRWHDFEVQAVWSARDSGLIRVWRNGRVVHEHRGRNLNRNVAPSFKFGLYRTSLRKYRRQVGPVVPTQVVVFDEVARGTKRSAVALR